MSDRRRIYLIALAAIVSGPVHAQVVASAPDSLLAQVRRLDSLMVVQRQVVDSVRKRVVRPAPAVDVRTGSVHVRTDSALAPRVRDAVAAVNADIERRGDSTFVRRTTEHVLAITRDSARSVFGVSPTITIRADTTHRWSIYGQRQVSRQASSADIRNSLTLFVEQFAMQGVDSTLAAWVMVGRAPLRLASSADYADAYIELATTESAALRRCRSGQAAACLDALGVDSAQAPRLTRWYSPDDYRAMLRTTPPRNDSLAVAAWLHCRQDRDDAACGVAALALPNDRIPLPLSGSVRSTFLAEVLERGGAGSFDRLRATPGNLRDRIEAASRESAEVTVARWLARVEASRPDRMRLSPGILLASLGWSSAILVLAFTRRASWV
jgi:hypothetical protein